MKKAVGANTRGILNFSRTVRGMTKWFWATIEGYLSYILHKLEDFIHTD